MNNDEFGQYTLPDESLKGASIASTSESGFDTSVDSSSRRLDRMMYEDPQLGNVFSNSDRRSYDEGSNIRMRRVEYSREVQVLQKAKGGLVAKWGFIFGVASAVMGLIFLGGFLVEEAFDSGGFIAMAGCWLGLLGALFSVAGIILCIIGLALGAGLNRGKAIFGLIFSVLYWIMLGLELMLAVFIVASTTQPEIFIW